MDVSIVQDGSHANCEAYFQDWYLEDGTCLSHGIRKGINLFIYFRQARKVRSRMFFYTMEHGMRPWSLRMSSLKRCCRKTQTWCASPTNCFLCGTRTTASKLGCHTLTYCTVMIHRGAYLQILFYSTLLKGLWSCSQPWQTWTSKTSSFWLIYEDMVFYFLSPKSDFSNSCVGVLSLTMSSQVGAWVLSNSRDWNHTLEVIQGFFANKPL